MTVVDRSVGGQIKASAKRALLNFNYYNEETYFMQREQY